MLCGSTDIETLIPEFEKEISLFEATPLCFINGKFNTNNYLDWKENSVKTLQGANIVVFVLMHNYGKITWETEFKRAKEIGIPYVVLCYNDTFIDHADFNNNRKEFEKLDANKSKVFKLLNNFRISEKGSIETFLMNDFGRKLRLRITDILRESTETQKEENAKVILLNLIRKRDRASLRALAKVSNKKYLKSILRDIFQPKEVRKRVLEVFSLNESLALNEFEIIDYLNDPEQGIIRKTILLLPQLVRSGYRIEVLFDELIKLSNNNDDVGFDRRALISMLEIDILLAVKKLQVIKMDDVGTPRRIVNWLFENKEKVINLKFDSEFKKDLALLMERCKNYSKVSDKWKDNIEPILSTLN
jgi:hypothetical protein